MPTTLARQNQVTASTLLSQLAFGSDGVQGILFAVRQAARQSVRTQAGCKEPAGRRLSQRLPLLREAAHYIGHPAIRNRSTVGGSIAHADPAAELPAVILALNAEFVVRSLSGSRTISARDFFKGPLTTDLKEGELLTELRVPGPPARAGAHFVEFARREGDYALAGVAAVIALDEDGTIADARLGLCSVGPTPLHPKAAEDLLRGQRPGQEAWDAAASAVVAALDNPPSDIHGSADYRRHLAGVLTRQALATAAERPSSSPGCGAERNR